MQDMPPPYIGAGLAREIAFEGTPGGGEGRKTTTHARLGASPEVPITPQDHHASRLTPMSDSSSKNRINQNRYIAANPPCKYLPVLSTRRSPCPPHLPPRIVMPVVQARPRGQTVRPANTTFHLCGLMRRKARAFVEGYHFGPLWSRRKVVCFDTDVPINESPDNICYVDMKSKFSRTGTSLNIHESRVHIGQDMFLVSGYWDPKADVNRSVFAAMKVIWKGELSVVRAGRYIPYHKRMRDGNKAELAVKRFVKSFTSHSVCLDSYDVR